MPLPPPGVYEREPGELDPPKSLGGQKLLWLLGGPHSAGNWNERQRRGLLLALRAVLGCIPTIWGVFVIRACALVPDFCLWWILFGSMICYALWWLFRFVGEQPTRTQTRVLILIVAVMDLTLVSRFSADERVAWLFVIPAGLVVASSLAKQIATGMALWTTHVLSAPAAERARARAEWHAGHGTPELATLRRGHAVIGLAYVAALAVTLIVGDRLLPWLAFVVVAIGGWCLLCAEGRSPLHVAGVTWRTVVLWTSYNPPLPTGRTLLEPYTYQMADPWLELADRVFAVRLAVMSLAIGVVAAVFASGWAANIEFRTASDLVIAIVRHVFVVTLIPFLVFFTTLFVTYGTVLTDYYSRFAAVAVAEAERRSAS